jgi:hypothetical protein
MQTIKMFFFFILKAPFGVFNPLDTVFQKMLKKNWRYSIKDSHFCVEAPLWAYLRGL